MSLNRLRDMEFQRKIWCLMAFLWTFWCFLSHGNDSALSMYSWMFHKINHLAIGLCPLKPQNGLFFQQKNMKLYPVGSPSCVNKKCSSTKSCYFLKPHFWLVHAPIHLFIAIISSVSHRFFPIFVLMIQPYHFVPPTVPPVLHQTALFFI